MVGLGEGGSHGGSRPGQLAEAVMAQYAADLLLRLPALLGSLQFIGNPTGFLSYAYRGTPCMRADARAKQRLRRTAFAQAWPTLSPCRRRRRRLVRAPW
jgi:hypothetical protein